jgi:hypothetical protein
MEKITTTEQFNDKYSEYLEEGHYGLDIEYPEIVEYLDEIFEGLLTSIPGFSYSQIKLKFNYARFYASVHPDLNNKLFLRITQIIEMKLNMIFQEIWLKGMIRDYGIYVEEIRDDATHDLLADDHIVAAYDGREYFLKENNSLYNSVERLIIQKLKENE